MGDAIAGLLITFINVIAGMIIGILQNDMAIGDAADAYTRLTVGDGLVSQIPALIVSTAAGMIVTKAGVETTEKRFPKWATNRKRRPSTSLGRPRRAAGRARDSFPDYQMAPALFDRRESKRKAGNSPIGKKKTRPTWLRSRKNRFPRR